MTKIRILILLLTIFVVGFAGYALILYANGYRLNKDNKLVANGLLVANSDPNGAQILIDGKLNSATNATITLSPGSYSVDIKKEGYLDWNKQIQIQNGIVTEVDASLFPQAVSLNPITFAGAINPVISPDYSKIVYGDATGIWVVETINLPLGFNSAPTEITDLVPDANTTWSWSPDSRQILVKTKTSNYLLNISSTTTVSQLVDLTATLAKTKAEWQTTQDKQLQSLISKLPDGLQGIFTNDTSNVLFSPDQTKVLYTATSSAIIPDGLVPPLPGSSTQKQTRSLVKNHIYVYDLKEDRNFEITDVTGPIYWFASSRNLIIPEKDKLVIEDYDNTNKQTVYGGSYVYPNAFPTPNTNRVFILTNLGATNGTPNLYSLNLR
ncbi:MAG TPA: PEGA domain-containing protein [Patescibacteria group bacterium]|nr:PEGA domain-containing protein [Patescibacteria group bacterium]